MGTPTTDRIAELLSHSRSSGKFALCRTARPDDLAIEVAGLGPLRFPITGDQAQRLCALARPARYGQGERTLLDQRVRHTWEIPKSRLKIDLRRWKKTLSPTLETLRAELGLPAGVRLKAELHNLLVYAPGQFFLPHQDSEKSDAMIGTLVVVLPGSFTGGSFVVEHQGEKVTCRGSRDRLSFIAFYADCRHEVKPVKTGYRVVLSYNLVAESLPAAGLSAASGADPSRIAALAGRLRAFFEEPMPKRWDDDEKRRYPRRLVYFLDHQYTERGLAWSRLKGQDLARSSLLLAAVQEAGCAAALALAEVHETRACEDPDWERPWERGSGRYWERDDDDDWIEEDPELRTGPDDYVMGELIDSEIHLSRWVAPGDRESTPIESYVAEEETCASTPTSALKAHTSEYEGYTGNAGNTMDRWYHRAAIVVWPRELGFAVRGEAQPGWALDNLRRLIESGRAGEARELAASLPLFWSVIENREDRAGILGEAQRVALGLGEPKLAFSVLEPFRLEDLATPEATGFAALVERFGEPWAQGLVAVWSRAPRSGYAERGAFEWIASLPMLCRALAAKRKGGESRAARVLIENRWSFLRQESEAAARRASPSQRRADLERLTPPARALLESIKLARAEELRQTMVEHLKAPQGEELLLSMVRLLRTQTEARKPDLDASLKQHASDLLKKRLALPERKPGDWSIRLPKGCSCELCAVLRGFLTSASEQRLEWPLAKEKRQHIHSRLDLHGLPVSHETRRSGRPFTLVLVKTRALFDQPAQQRREYQSTSIGSWPLNDQLALGEGGRTQSRA